MAITFHCDHCGKKINAKEDNAGRWGKCPSCHNRVYVPDLSGDPNELKLAPLDDEEIERQQQLLAETHRLTLDILQERVVPDELRPAADVPVAQMSEEELYHKIVRYLRQMADGNLDAADRTAAVIRTSKKHAKAILDRISVSEIPEAELADIPPHVLSGFIRTLRSNIT